MKSNTPSISAAELMQRLHKHEDIMLVDVREPWEHNAYNIGGALISLHEIFDSIYLISCDKVVVMYCEKGIRSQIAIQRLQQRFAFGNLVNLLGGMEAWKREVQAQLSYTQH